MYDADAGALATADQDLKAAEEFRKRIDDVTGTRVLNKTIAMYMTQAITLNDTMNYDQESRKTAAGYEQLKDSVIDNKDGNKKGLSREDIKVVGSAFATEIATAGGYWLGSKINMPILGAGLVGTAANVVGDEMLRGMGKALNPNEYMQYKNTALRTFSFQWKMLPDSSKESMDCAEIIKTLRAAAHAHKKSSMVLTVPDFVHMSFHGVGGMFNLPAVVISSVSVTYNPNAASFFKQNNNPVEIDLAVTLSEIVPIYRDDVELGGL